MKAFKIHSLYHNKQNWKSIKWRVVCSRVAAAWVAAALCTVSALIIQKEDTRRQCISAA